MFGHQNNQQDQAQDDSQAMEHGINAIVNNDVTPPPSGPSFTPPPPPFDPPASPLAPPPLPADAPVDQDDDQTPSPDVDLSVPEPSTPAPDTNGLLDIKQQALTELSPLVGHLEQSPEERFRTTMMMIQANDNQALIKDAYEAAQQIGDEKTRAQALLDVINEINYFTQKKA